MTQEIEIERTFLAKFIPDGLIDLPYREINDYYFPYDSRHPSLRIRSTNDTHVMTKKTPVEKGDYSILREETIGLSDKELEAFIQIKSNKIAKRRYIYEHMGLKFEFDLFLDSLYGLVLIDLEFNSKEDQQDFESAEFILADVTHNEFIAGGILAGKTYSDIEKPLEKFTYKKLEYSNE